MKFNFAGDIMECGGKRSATPLLSFQTQIHGSVKAPSPLRSAGALQNSA
jgi:hypothetical protein